MTNQEKGQSDPEHILKLKDEVLERLGQLPAEHQATIALVTINAVMAGEWGQWLKEAIALRHPPEAATSERLFPITALSREDLKQAHFSDEEIAQLTDNDLQDIARKMEDHFVDDVFWDELLRHEAAFVK